MEGPPSEMLNEVSSALRVQIAEVSERIPGCSHIIYVLKLKDGKKLTLRVANHELGSSMANKSIPIMKHILEVQSTLQIPAVFHTAEKYMVLKYMNGAPIGLWDSSTMSEQRRHKILEGLVEFLHKLWTCPVPNTERAMTYRKWLLSEVDKAIIRSIRYQGWGHPIKFIQRRILVDTLVPRNDEPRLCVKHGDLHALNILVDDSGLSGVIDWDTVSYVPAPAAVHYPLFIAGIPGWRNGRLPDGTTFEAERSYLHDAMRKKSVTDNDHVAELLGGSWERQFFEMSLRNKLVNQEYVKLRLQKTDHDKNTMRDQLKGFLLAHDEMRSEPAVVEMQEFLDKETTE